MKILGIETSCDETSISVIEAESASEIPAFKVLSHALYSQIETHKPYGGVFPALAKREHSRNLVPLLGSALVNAELFEKVAESENKIPEEKIRKVLEREPELVAPTLDFLKICAKPKIDAIAVTQGPGLEPALWTGINFAKILSLVWGVPLMPVDHMEGHLVSVLLSAEEKTNKKDVNFPAVALLISGGHTELVLIKKFGEYEVVGKTVDDAVGEAYDKVARLMGMPYPGGPEISNLAKIGREQNLQNSFNFPRPMLSHEGFDFSFSGLKTAVLYQVKKILEAGAQEILTQEEKIKVATSFEEAVKDTLLEKTRRALEKFSAKTLIVAGGVISNEYLRENLKKFEDSGVSVFFPSKEMSTDNSIMIAIAGHLKFDRGDKPTSDFRASGNLSL